MQSETSLLPCPFCGGEVIETGDYEGGSWITHKIVHTAGGLPNCILTGVELNTTTRAKADWNTRAPSVDMEASCSEITDNEQRADDFSVIREALIAAPVYTTKDGTWLNLRPDAEKKKGGAMFKIEGDETEAVRAYGEKVNAALIALSRVEG